MTIKTLTITEDAYTRLAAEKEDGESFSDVIRRITGKRSLLDLVGILSEKEAAELERAVRKTRREMDRRLARTARALR
jgi:predicted CopG family antitoxin